MEKTKRLELRLTPDEYKTLQNIASQSGISMSEYLRLGIGGYREPKKVPDEFRRAIKKLNHIGINLNQLTILARQNYYDVTKINECIEDLNKAKKILLETGLNI